MPGSAPMPKRKTRRARRRATFDTTLGRALLQVVTVVAYSGQVCCKNLRGAIRVKANSSPM